MINHDLALVHTYTSLQSMDVWSKKSTGLRTASMSFIAEGIVCMVRLGECYHYAGKEDHV